MSIRNRLIALALIFATPVFADGVNNGSTPTGLSPIATSGSASDLSTGTLASARLPSGLSQVLGSLRGANFNTTADQAIAIRSGITAFQITSIAVTNCSASLSLSAGGFYPTTAKGGTAIVAAGQLYAALTGSSVLLNPTVAATPLVTRYAISNVYLSLTAAQGGAATCDVYVIGNDLT